MLSQLFSGERGAGVLSSKKSLFTAETRRVEQEENTRSFDSRSPFDCAQGRLSQARVALAHDDIGRVREGGLRPPGQPTTPARQKRACRGPRPRADVHRSTGMGSCPHKQPKIDGVLASRNRRGERPGAGEAE